MTIIQRPSLVLPAITNRIPNPNLDTEIIADLLTHISIELDTEYLQDNEIHIWAVEVAPAALPGPLWAWIELSPYNTPITGAFWGAIGGGGGPSYPANPAMVPIAPIVEAATGVNGTVHNILIPWAIHSPYARLVVQTPVAANLPLNFWVIQAYYDAKTAR